MITRESLSVVQRTSEATLVLSSVSKAMPRWERISEPHSVGEPSAQYEDYRQQPWQVYWSELEGGIQSCDCVTRSLKEDLSAFSSPAMWRGKCLPTKCSALLPYSFSRYQEYIADKNHVHMNGTCWSSLNQFVQTLVSNGICEVEDTERVGVFHRDNHRDRTLPT